MKSLEDLFDRAIKKYFKETKDLEFLPQNRFNKKMFPSLGQYDWFSGQLLYCLVRYKKPERIVEVSTSSGYSGLFMGLALKKNGFGHLDTFEINKKKAEAAKLNFKYYSLEKFVKVWVGDAKKNLKKVKGIENCDIQFLDSDHTESFARWFIDELVMKNTKKNALFHMHDILPEHAKVRKFDGPPWGINTIHFYRKIVWKLINSLQGVKIEEVSIEIREAKGKELSNYSGNEGTEPLFGNTLTKEMAEKDFVYLYDIADKYKRQLSSRKYDNTAYGTQDKFGNPFEWNGSLWAISSSIKKAYREYLKNVK
jgi:predicted O-methyltransferase YrrM